MGTYLHTTPPDHPQSPPQLELQRAFESVIETDPSLLKELQDFNAQHGASVSPQGTPSAPVQASPNTGKVASFWQKVRDTNRRIKAADNANGDALIRGAAAGVDQVTGKLAGYARDLSAMTGAYKLGRDLEQQNAFLEAADHPEANNPFHIRDRVEKWLSAPADEQNGLQNLLQASATFAVGWGVAGRFFNGSALAPVLKDLSEWEGTGAVSSAVSTAVREATSKALLAMRAYFAVKLVASAHQSPEAERLAESLGRYVEDTTAFVDQQRQQAAQPQTTARRNPFIPSVMSDSQQP